MSHFNKGQAKKWIVTCPSCPPSSDTPAFLQKLFSIKLGARPFSQYLSESSSAIPNHILQWLSQRQSRITTTTEKTQDAAVLPLSGAATGDNALDNQQGEKPSQRSAAPALATNTLKGLPTTSDSTPRPKLIPRPAYNPKLAKKDKENDNDVSNSTKG